MDMWNPTHVQVIVQKAKDLIIKGKDGTNDAYVVVQLGKERYMTSIKTKCTNPIWYEECDLLLNDKTRNLEIIVYHRNFFGMDEFLGHVTISFQDLEISKSPQTKWYMLQSKKDKKNDKYRGQLELTVSFIISETYATNDSSNIYSKSKTATKLKQLMSRAGQIKLPHLPRRSFSLKSDSSELPKQLQQLRERRLSEIPSRKSVSSEEDIEEETVPSLTHRKYDISRSSLKEQEELVFISNGSKPIQRTYSMPGCSPEKSINSSNKTDRRQLSVSPENWKQFLLTESEVQVTKSDSSLIDGKESSADSLSEIKFTMKEKKGKLQLLKRYSRRHSVQLTTDLSETILERNDWINKASEIEPNLDYISKDELHMYKAMNRKQLVDLVVKQQLLLSRQKDKIQDLENYIDDLLVRVMETSPRILHISYKTSSLEYVR
ncbi:rab11 family-interacting protein 1-like isoform X1 [Centruroides sculpturatus]|uniref:rab11 family-interacting protein 1-like isoform X1 n=1 Tax=Centruroides sculpturatus TaxID=218467 RepID=UPI000C6D0772|nr:rab11 family-interacting protein 1-like isoform X1 [Centruroides sculpturatus]